MAFSTISYLFGLLGIMIPIAIHLWSRKETRIRKVGSVRFLPESETSQSSSIQLNEKRLLALRSLLLGLLCFILADLLIPKTEDKSSQVILIEPALLSNNMVQRALDTLENENIRLWQSGFPKLNQTDNIDSSRINHWNLINSSKYLSADTLLVFIQGSINALDGKRIISTKTFKWLLIDPLEANTYVHRSFKNESGSFLLKGNSASTATSYQFEIVAEVEDDFEEWDTLHFDIVFDRGFEQDRIYINAALRSVEELINRPFNVRNHEKSTFEVKEQDIIDWLIWLSDEPIISTTDKTSVLQLDESDFEELIVESSEGFSLTQRLTRGNVLSEDLAGSLLEIIVPVKLDDKDIRQASVSQISPILTAQIDSISNEQYSINNWLWVLLILIFTSERYYSFSRGL